MEELNQNARFTGATWYKNPRLNINNVKIIGVGGIGSHLAFKLARINVGRLHLYDDDIVENHNIGGQLFSEQQIGKYKVVAVKEIIEAMVHSENNTALFVHQCKISSFPYSYDYERNVYFVCVDNMEARISLAQDAKRIWNRPGNSNVFYYFESRLSPVGYEIYCVSRENVDFYIENCLFQDSEANGATCSYQQTTHVASALASRLVNIYTNILTNEMLNEEHETDLEYLPVPFYIRENSDLLTLKICRDVNTWGE
jgi:molybdopterin/thiamine biosynthesis adenylyltransferase